MYPNNIWPVMMAGLAAGLIGAYCGVIVFGIAWVWMCAMAAYVAVCMCWGAVNQFPRTPEAKYYIGVPRIGDMVRRQMRESRKVWLRDLLWGLVLTSALFALGWLAVHYFDVPNNFATWFITGLGSMFAGFSVQERRAANREKQEQYRLTQSRQMYRYR